MGVNIDKKTIAEGVLISIFFAAISATIVLFISYHIDKGIASEKQLMQNERIRINKIAIEHNRNADREVKKALEGLKCSILAEATQQHKRDSAMQKGLSDITFVLVNNNNNFKRQLDILRNLSIYANMSYLEIEDNNQISDL